MEIRDAADIHVKGITTEKYPKGVAMKIKQVDMLVRNLELTDLKTDSVRTLAEAYGSRGREKLTNLMKEIAMRLASTNMRVDLPQGVMQAEN